MSKYQFENLCHTFRWMRWLTTHRKALFWIGFFEPRDRVFLERLYGEDG